MSARVLVLGGAGYIGSHMVKLLVREGLSVTIFDNLVTGHRDVLQGCDFVEGDIRDEADLQRAFSGKHFGAVMHFAAHCYVGESVADPAKYYSNNMLGTLRTLDAMRRFGVNKLVFSSSCATYGIPDAVPIAESHPQRPVSPYGVTKYVSERMIRDYGAAYGVRAVSLRYFNAAGCDPDGELGERHDPETHLIPLVLKEAIRVSQGGDPKNTTLKVFGDAYSTPDGTCIRDYVHVADLCAAHLLAMHRLLEGRVEGFEAYNLGSERGFSVKEVIEVSRAVSGVPVGYEVSAPRPGDPAELVADASRAKEVLGWKPQYAALERIIGTAWKWFKGR